METLILFEKPDLVINVMNYNNNNEYYLEIGDDFIYESDDMSDDEIIEWAKNYGYLDEREGYLDDDGQPLVDSLRSVKRSQEEEYPSSHATPSGRAFIYFEEIDIPEIINVDVIDGLHPGNDWQGVIVNGIDHLILLQKYLFEKGSKVNFILV